MDVNAPKIPPLSVSLMMRSVGPPYPSNEFCNRLNDRPSSSDVYNRNQAPLNEVDMDANVNNNGEDFVWKKALRCPLSDGKTNSVLEGGYGLSGKKMRCINVSTDMDRQGAFDSAHAVNASSDTVPSSQLESLP